MELTEILSAVLMLIFYFLGGMHFYWVLGGKWGLEAALPSKETGEVMLEVGKLGTSIVGLGLCSFGTVYWLKTGWIQLEMLQGAMPYLLWIIPSIFALRAIGDFNYVGFFKKVKNTRFANADTRFFSPLCAFIAVAAYLIQLIKH